MASFEDQSAIATAPSDFNRLMVLAGIAVMALCPPAAAERTRAPLADVRSAEVARSTPAQWAAERSLPDLLSPLPHPAPDEALRLAALAVAPGLSAAVRLDALAGPVQLAGLSSSRPSGLAWRSGASCADNGTPAWRQRPFDVQTTFVEHDTWEMMRDHMAGNWFRNRNRATPQPVVSLPMLPRSERKQFARCAAGAFDTQFRRFGTLLVQGGAGNAVVRLGWEWARGSRSHPWGVDSEEELGPYKGCFRRAVRALKATAPNLIIEWTNGRRSYLPVSVLQGYPGGDVVDHWGIHYYDNFDPKIRDQAAWDRSSNETRFNGPQGIGRWLAAAKARGKKLSISEWGVTDFNGQQVGYSDNPFYIGKMYEFFKANAADLAFENYFNCPLKHQLYPSQTYSKSRARYKELWSPGR